MTTAVWVLATVLSAVAAFLRQPLVGSSLGADIGVGVLLFGLAAAVLAQLDSMPGAVLAGVCLGMLDRGAYYGTGNPRLSVALVLPVLLVALLRPTRAKSRAFDSGISTFRVSSEIKRVPSALRGLPEVRVATWGGRLLLLAAGIAAPSVVGVARIPSLTAVVVSAVVAVSLVVLTGWAGQVSLGQFGTAGVGAAVAGGLATHTGADFFLTLLAAVAAGALVSTLIGIPALRLPGLLLAVVTLAYAAFVQEVVLQRRYTGWLLPADQESIGRPVLFGRWDVTSDRAFYYVCLAGLGLSLLVADGLRRSRSGRVFISARDNTRASQSYGISALRTRLAAFALSGGIAALGGALLAYQQQTVQPSLFPVELSVLVFVTAVVGGITSPLGAVLGAVLYGMLRYDGDQLFGWLGSIGLGSLLDVIDEFGIATGVLFVLGFFPSGLAGSGEQLRDRWLRRVAERRGIRVPSLVADSRVADPLEAETAPAVVETDAPDDALLVVRDLRVAYDGVKVLFGVDLHVRRGEIVAFLGTNGAGKSTALKAVAGLAPATGSVVFAGEELAGTDTGDRVRKGVVLVPGGKGVFPTLTVADHFRAARWLHPDAEAAQAQVLTWFPRLAERWDALAGDMSGGEQQQLAVGMAFLSQPELLIIDELSLGLSPVVVEQLLHVVREINSRGTAVVLVEQSVNVALSVADRAYFLEKGEVRFSGPTAELLDRDDVLRSVFLSNAAPAVATERVPDERPADAPVLSVRELGISFGGVRAVDGVSFDLAPREVLGLIGQNGAGKTTVLDLVSGFLVPDRGTVSLLGTDVTELTPDARARLGLGRSFQDARVFASLTVAENIATALERHLPFRDHLASALRLPDVRWAEEQVAWTVADLVELLGLGDLRDKQVAELSTGSRRIVDLAMALAFDPDVLLLDEPSSGIAQRESEALVPLLRRVRDETGTALVVIEHDMPLIREVSDRLVALELGQVLAEGTPAEVLSDPRVQAGYLGTDTATIERSGAR